ncbi:MAG: DUF4126 domain-containing protein [Vulcanimicrobiaceae bacterium]
MEATTQYALAYALTTSAGLRGLLTLAVVSVAVHAGIIHPVPGFLWLGSTAVTIALVAVAATELVADKVPMIDHVLHVLQVVIKPAAAAVLVGGIVHTQHPQALYALMALGALDALGIHAASATARASSTAATAGAGNPLLSAFEDILAGILMVFAFIAPFLGAALAAVLTISVVRIAMGFVRRWRLNARGV